ncbi:outer membrane protein assembly factor BamA [Crocinitomicaceae bacterium]|nr:outer membrane protein assembly factor BamA [Crocinitomicaceae bacterium]
MINLNRFLSFCFFSLMYFSSQAQDNSVLSIGKELEFDYSHPKKYEIGSVRIDGAENYDHNAIRLIAGLKPGQQITIPSDDISKAISNLWKEELFSDIEIFAEKEVAGVIYLVIKIAPRPKLSRYKFNGASKKEVDKIREEIDLFSGKTITENLVYITKNEIVSFYKEKGYYSVEVNIKRITDTLINNSEIFYIDVDKKDKVKIQKIEIEGNQSIPTWKLKMAMKDTKKKSVLRFWKRSKFSEIAFERDKQAVLDKFNAIGFRDANFEYDSVYLEGASLNIKLKIDEGSKYYFGDIEWIGNTKFRSSYLDTVLGIKKGDMYDKPLLDERLTMSQDGRDISSLYMDRGYLFFQVIPIETNVEDNHINFQMRIIEGKEARVKRIIIKGNTKTNDYVIRREIRTKPGDLFNRNDIIRTQRELAQLGYFNEQAFQINPIPNPADGTVDIEYTVEEKSSDQIELSGGYGGNNNFGNVTNAGSGLIGTLGLTFNNFSTKNFFKKDSWSPLPGGDGQRLSIRAQSNGRFFQSYNFSFTEPWLGGKKPNSLTYWINHTALNTNGVTKANENYTGIGITGAGVGLGRRKKIPDDYFSAYYELAYQYYDLTSYALWGQTFADGYANDISFKYSLQRNSVSAPIYPQGGSKIAFTAKSSLPYSYIGEVNDYALLSAQDRYKYLEYYKLKFTSEWFMPLTMDKKLVFRTKFGMAFLGAYNKSRGLIPSERFTMGGSGLSGVNQMGGREVIALRGYEDGALSSASGDPLVAKYVMELRYPISLNPQATFYLLAFAEGGNTFPSFAKFNPLNVKRSAGIGLRVFLPMFGMLGLDYGWGFDKMDTWSNGYNGVSDSNIRDKGYHTKLTFSIGMNLGDL